VQENFNIYKKNVWAELSSTKTWDSSLFAIIRNAFRLQKRLAPPTYMRWKHLTHSHKMLPGSLCVSLGLCPFGSFSLAFNLLSTLSNLHQNMTRWRMLPEVSQNLPDPRTMRPIEQNYLAIVETIRCSTDDDNNYVQKSVRPFHPCRWIDVPGNPSTIRPHASIGGHLFWKFQTTTASTHMRLVLAVLKFQNAF
jgi:hypothetical protein